MKNIIWLWGAFLLLMSVVSPLLVMILCWESL